MTHYRFDWALFATDALLSRLLAAAGASTAGAAERDLLRPLAARIFSRHRRPACVGTAVLSGCSAR